MIDIVIPRNTKVTLNGVEVIFRENLHFNCAARGDDYDAVAEQLSAAGLLDFVDLTHDEKVGGVMRTITYGAGGARQVCEKRLTVKRKQAKSKT